MTARSDARTDHTTLVTYRVVAGLFAMLVLVQAALAGQFLNGQGTLVAVHRALGAQVLPSLTVVLVVLAVLLRRRSRSWLLLVVAGSLLALTTLQTGLGFLGRQSLGAASLHVPLGVTIFGLAVYNMVVAGARASA